MRALRGRRTLPWVVAGLSLVAAAAVVALTPGVRGWLAVAAVGGAASVVTTAVTTASSRATAKGREALLGRPDPIVVTLDRTTVARQPAVRRGLRDIQEVRFTVEATQSQAVVLDDLRATVARRGMRRGNGGFPMSALRLRHFLVDLDDPVRAVMAARPRDDFPLTVSPTDPERLAVIARSDRRFVEWSLELHWTFRGRHGSTRIPAEGDFRLTAQRAAPPGP